MIALYVAAFRALGALGGDPFNPGARGRLMCYLLVKIAKHTRPGKLVEIIAPGRSWSPVRISREACQ